MTTSKSNYYAQDEKNARQQPRRRYRKMHLEAEAVAPEVDETGLPDSLTRLEHINKNACYQLLRRLVKYHGTAEDKLYVTMMEKPEPVPE